MTKRQREGFRMLAQADRLELHTARLERRFRAQQEARETNHALAMGKLKRRIANLITRGTDYTS